jgi:hypothetical protein
MTSDPPPSPGSALSVSSDASRKLVRVQFRGVVTAEQVSAEVDRMRELVATFPPGFTMITDLTALERMDIDCGPHVARLMDVCLHAGIAEVIRVIPDQHKDIGFTILSLIHYRGKVRTVTVETREEAERSAAGNQRTS